MLTVLAHWWDDRPPDPRPLLFRLSVDLPDAAVTVVFVGPPAAAAAALPHLRRYSPCFPWACAAAAGPGAGGGVPLGLLVPPGDVLELPASAVPVGRVLGETKFPFRGRCYAPGAWAAYCMDAHGTGLTPRLLADCPPAAAVVVLAARGVAVEPAADAAPLPFVVYPPPRSARRPRLDELVHVLEVSS